MTKRNRKLVGAIIIVIYAVIYILGVFIAMAVANSVASDVGMPLKMLFYAVVGMAWIFPLMPLIRWMERPDRDKA